MHRACRWDGFEASDAARLILACAAAGLCAGSVAYAWLACTEARVRARPAARRHAAMLGVAAFAVALGSAELLGKQTFTAAAADAHSLMTGQQYTVQPLGRHHAAGTAGMAYSQAGLARVLQYLESVDLSTAPPIDTLIGKKMLQDVSELHALEVRPSLVQHIGAYSSGYKNHGDIGKLTQDSRFVP